MTLARTWLRPRCSEPPAQGRPSLNLQGEPAPPPSPVSEPAGMLGKESVLGAPSWGWRVGLLTMGFLWGLEPAKRKKAMISPGVLPHPEWANAPPFSQWWLVLRPLVWRAVLRFQGQCPSPRPGSQELPRPVTGNWGTPALLQPLSHSAHWIPPAHLPPTTTRRVVQESHPPQLEPRRLLLAQKLFGGYCHYQVVPQNSPELLRSHHTHGRPRDGMIEWMTGPEHGSKHPARHSRSQATLEPFRLRPA